MINGTSSKNSSKKMTYNSSGKSSGRHQHHHHHHNQHHHGQNHHQGHHGLGQSSLPSAALANSSAMAAMLNQATMAAILTQYHAMPGMQGSNHRHQATMPPPPLNYFNFYNPSGVPDDPRYLYYHAQQSLPGGHTINRDKEKVTMKPEQQKVLYSKALQGSMSQSNSSPVTSASGLASSLTHPGNGTSMSSNSYHSKSPSGHFGHGSRNMPPLSSGNMRSLGKGSPQPSYSNRHNQPYHNSRIPSNTSSSSPPAAGSVQTGSLSTNGSTSVVSASGNNTASSNVLSSSTSNSLSMNSVTNGTTSDKSDSNSTISKTNLYIRGLTPNTTDKDLHSLCSPYGTIVSTKAILDKDTNRCKGYGFVDFENPNAAEKAVKSLLSQGVQAQMARCTETNRHRNSYTKLLPHEHDPTNLYIANLPLNMTEADLEAMLSMYGSVVSTRILKDSNGAPRGVGFARMESKEKCESIIGILNGKMLAGSKDTLLVKFADGGGKKKHYKSESRFRNDSDLAYDSTNMATNGVPAQLLPSPLGASYHQRFQSPYQNPMQANPWMHPQAPPPQYLMQPQMIPSNLDPNTALQYSPLMHQLTAQMSHLQLGGGAGYMAGNPHAYGTQIYPTQMMPPMQMSGEVGLGGSASPSKIDPILTPQQETINPSQSASSGSASGEESQSQPQQQSQAPTSQQPAFQMCYNQK